MHDDILDDRKKSILKAIIDDYIETAEAIGSRTIARRHELGLSSATIRNEMADLEEMGYLAQIHTSSGRIPSDKGYRMYVDQLMQLKALSDEETKKICNALEMKINELSQLIRQTAAIMSRVTQYTSMATTPRIKKSILKAIQVVPIEPGKTLVITVDDAGVVRNSLVKIKDKMAPDFLIRISNIINEKLKGLALEQINLNVINAIKKEISVADDILIPILDGVAECIGQVESSDIFLDGATNIFKHPEFMDMERAREFLNFLEEKTQLFKLLNEHKDNNNVNIQIGYENNVQEIKGFTLITTNYHLGNTVIGSIGIIGPTRMEYSKVVSSINYIRNKINEEIRKLLGDG